MFLIGNNIQSVGTPDLQKYFGSQMMMYIKSYITQFINSSNAEVLGICAYQVEISIIIAPFISKTIENYGLKLVSFSIESLDIPENDPHRMQLENAFALSGEMRVLGEDWARAKAADILKYLAQNPGAGNVASVGAGMGMGMAAAPVFANIAQQMFGSFPDKDKPSNLRNGNTDGASRFGLKHEKSTLTTEGDFEANIRKLKIMFDNGVISKEQYDSKIQEILSRM